MNEPQHVRYVDARYGRLGIFSNDIGSVTQSLLTYGEWAENEISFLYHFIQTGSVVVDAGAYIGTHTIAFSRRVGPSGAVIAFEPQPETFHLLRTNVLANDLSNVRLEQVALSNFSGNVSALTIDTSFPASFASTSLSDVLHHSEPAAEVEPRRQSLAVGSIDQLALRQCDLIKLDVEGTEDLALKGASVTIANCSPIIYAECNSAETGIATLNVLRQHDYATFLHVVDAYNPGNFFGQSNNIFGSAREIAIVGISRNKETGITKYKVHSHELLLKIETIDDLVLGLLNKPQYFAEILRKSAAARTGGYPWLDRIDSFEEKAEENRTRTIVLEQALEAAEAKAEENRTRTIVLEQALEAAEAKVNRAMLQCQLIRSEKELAKGRELEALAKIDLIYRSTSWRLTRPLRLLVKSIRGA